MDLMCRTQLLVVISVKGQSHCQGQIIKLCPVHNFAMSDGILIKLGRFILLMDLMCRTQLSATVNHKVKVTVKVKYQYFVQSITLQCLMGF